MTNSLHHRIICYVLEVATFQLPGTLRTCKRKATQISYTAAGTISQSRRVSLPQHRAERESGINHTLHYPPALSTLIMPRAHLWGGGAAPGFPSRRHG